MNWIREDVVIDFEVPRSLLHLIEELEKCDQEQNYAYDNYAEALDVGCKELCRQGKLTEEQWDTLCVKYVYVG